MAHMLGVIGGWCDHQRHRCGTWGNACGDRAMTTLLTAVLVLYVICVAELIRALALSPTRDDWA